MAALVSVAQGFSPRVEVIGPLVLLDVGGLSRVFGSPRELGEHLLHEGSSRRCLTGVPHGGSSREVPYEGAVAVAPSATSAALLALHRPGLTVVPSGGEAAALAPLPISVLDRFEQFRTSLRLGPTERPRSGQANPKPQALSPKPPDGGWHHPRHTHQASRHPRTPAPSHLCTPAPSHLHTVLLKWGIRTLGALAALPSAEVHERLGARGVVWQRWARGEDDRPLVPQVDEAPFEGTLELEWPIEGLEPLSFVLARLLEPLAERLEQADRGAAVIYTMLRLTTRAVHARALQLPAPMRDPKTLRTLVLLDLESHPPDAAIDTVRVSVEPTPGRVVQWDLLERAQPAPEQVSTLVARLTALMGEGHVGSPSVVDTWRPGAFALQEFRVQSAEFRAPTAGCTTLNSERLTLNSALRRFRLPIPARVQVREGRPVRVAIDRHGLSSGAVVQAAGPWRTSGEWWSSASASSASSAAWDRDEWDIALADGTLYRLAVEREVGQWFIEGILD